MLYFIYWNVSNSLHCLIRSLCKKIQVKCPLKIFTYFISTKHRLVDENFEKSLSNIIADVILPSFIFCEVILNFDSNDSSLLIQLVCGCLIVHFVGIMNGYIYAKILKKDLTELKFLCAIISSPNSTSLQLIFLEVLSSVFSELSYPTNENSPGIGARERGLVYISLFSIFANIWRWTVAFQLVETVQDEEKQQVLILPEVYRKEEEEKNYTMKGVLSEILNVPIIVSAVTLLISYSQTVRSLFIQQNSFLRETILSVHFTIAKSYTFLVIFILGLNLSNLTGEDFRQDSNSEIDIKSILSITAIKLIVNPLVGAPVIIFLHSNGFIKDGIMAYQLLFMLAAPVAINLLVICNVKQSRVKFMSVLMLVMYLGSILTITINNSIFLYILINIK